MGSPATQQKIKVNTTIEPPGKYKVIYLNDDVTTVEFVVESLVSLFDYHPDEAMAVASTIHESGAAVVAVLPYELAEQKGVEVTILARNHGFPLAVKIEAE